MSERYQECSPGFSLTYIWHDCFIFRRPGNGAVIFDFWKDPREPDWKCPSWIKELKATGEPVLILVSHHHKDHFVREIFEWAADWPQVHYILSNDTARAVRHQLSPGSLWRGTRLREDQYTVLKRGESTDIAGFTVHAFGSTDIGNSYVVEVGGLKVFHAGDLNAWIWKDESTEAEVRKALGDYRAILKDISSAYPELDIAMMPVDSRIGTDYWTGAYELVRAIDIRYFFPMHFGLGEPEEQRRREADAIRFNLFSNPERGDYIALTTPGASFIHNCEKIVKFG